MRLIALNYEDKKCHNKQFLFLPLNGLVQKADHHLLSIPLHHHFAFDDELP